jgi:hypothetical protein
LIYSRNCLGEFGFGKRISTSNSKCTKEEKMLLRDLIEEGMAGRTVGRETNFVWKRKLHSASFVLEGGRVMNRRRGMMGLCVAEADGKPFRHPLIRGHAKRASLHMEPKNFLCA